MNQFLAELYKTAEAVGASTASAPQEKLAQAALLDQMLANDGINIEQLDNPTLLKVASELFGPNNEIQKLAEEGGEPTKVHNPAEEKEKKEETVEEKVAMADFLGRQMAHAYVQELSNIEKQAYIGPVPAKGHHVEKAVRAAKGAVHSLGKKIHESGPMQAHKLHAHLAGGGVKGHAKALAHEGGSHAGAAAAGAAGGAAAMHKHKEGSAVDLMAEKRAMEILTANGIVPEQSEAEKLASAVEQRAWEMLQAAGYQVEE